MIQNIPSDLPPASWIWAERPVDLADSMAQFRLQFEWDGTGNVFWLGFADTLYTIWCNGVPLGAGPIAGTMEEPYVSRWDLGRWQSPVPRSGDPGVDPRESP